jgi:hypothetical protein
MAKDKISYGGLVSIEQVGVTITSMVVGARLIPPLTSLRTEPVVVFVIFVIVVVHDICIGFEADNP